MHVQSEIVAAHEFEEKGAFYALEFLLSGLWFMVARERGGNLKNGAVGYREELTCICRQSFKSVQTKFEIDIKQLLEQIN
ncbi:hypothetical protein P8452_31752 [Trifolium repens]|nr:hypothetical protein P8452_31752 [Trifolium repens]